jgi:hypothetical protein
MLIRIACEYELRIRQWNLVKLKPFHMVFLFVVLTQNADMNGTIQVVFFCMLRALAAEEMLR